MLNLTHFCVGTEIFKKGSLVQGASDWNEYEIIQETPIPDEVFTVILL